jgi:acylphosphatase
VTDDRQAVRWLITGRVQGVGFRWFAQRQAEQMGITGWVRNLPDGRVEVAGRGAGPALDQFDQSLRRGPRFSHVERVDKTNIQHEDVDSKSFSIK